MICGSCLRQLPLVVEPYCEKCGKPIVSGEKLCHDCSEVEHFFTEGMGIFLYDEVMRKSIHKFKYLGRKEYGEFYGMAAWIYGKEKLKKWNPEVIVPIPIHSSRKKERGFNQAEVFGRVLGNYMNIPVASDALRRCTKTVAQKELTVEERRENLKNAFEITEHSFKWKRVLLVDDIYTTGSTMDSAALELKKYDIDEIYSLSICIGRGFVIQ